jgi:hypothetical protein
LVDTLVVVLAVALVGYSENEMVALMAASKAVSLVVSSAVVREIKTARMSAEKKEK